MYTECHYIYMHTNVIITVNTQKEVIDKGIFIFAITKFPQ